MSTQESRPQPAREPESSAASNATHLPILGLIAGLEQACRPGTSAEAFGRELLRGVVGLSSAVYGAYWRLSGKAPAAAPVDQVMPQVSAAAARAWAAALAELAAGVIQQTIIRYATVPEPKDQLLTGQRYLAVGFPVRGDAPTAGCVTVVVKDDNPILTDAGIALLQLLANFGLLYASSHAAARFERYYKSLSAAWDLIGESLAFKSPVEMAQVLCNRARTSLGADRVSLGFVRRDKVTVAAISGEDTIDKRSNVARLIQSAQTEIVVSGEAGSYLRPSPGEDRSDQLTRNPQQEQLARFSEASAVYSAPLRQAQDLVGVWTFEFGRTAFTPDVQQVVDVTAGQVGPLLHLARLNARGFVRRGVDGAAGAGRWIFGREHPWRKVAGLAALALIAWSVFGRWDFDITGTCRLEPSFRRVYAAPFNTSIKAAPVRPGDAVDTGQTLVLLDREDPELELREARSQRTSAQKEMDKYFAEQKMPLYREAQFRVEALSARIDILERHLAETDIQAEFAGVVIAGDLRQDIGRPVRMGEQLIEIAPLDQVLLEVEIAQGDVNYVHPGQRGLFTTKARPNESLPFTVAMVRPQPEVRNGAGVYIAEAVVSNAQGWLRPGMEGAAKVKVDRRNVAWVATRKLIDWIRLHLWW